MVIIPVKYLGYFCPLGWIRLSMHSQSVKSEQNLLGRKSDSPHIHWDRAVLRARTALDQPAAVPEVWQVPQNQQQWGQDRKQMHNHVSKDNMHSLPKGMLKNGLHKAFSAEARLPWSQWSMLEEKRHPYALAFNILSSTNSIWARRQYWGISYL